MKMMDLNKTGQNNWSPLSQNYTRIQKKCQGSGSTTGVGPKQPTNLGPTKITSTKSKSFIQRTNQKLKMSRSSTQRTRRNWELQTRRMMKTLATQKKKIKLPKNLTQTVRKFMGTNTANTGITRSTVGFPKNRSQRRV